MKSSAEAPSRAPVSEGAPGGCLRDRTRQGDRRLPPRLLFLSSILCPSPSCLSLSDAAQWKEQPSVLGRLIPAPAWPKVILCHLFSPVLHRRLREHQTARGAESVLTGEAAWGSWQQIVQMATGPRPSKAGGAHLSPLPGYEQSHGGNGRGWTGFRAGLGLAHCFMGRQRPLAGKWRRFESVSPRALGPA